MADVKARRSLEGGFMAARNQAKTRSFRDIRQSHLGSKVAAIDFTAGDLVVVMGIAESGWKFKAAIVAVETLMIFVLRLRLDHLGEIAMKPPRGPHRQSGDDPDNLRVTVKLLEQAMPILNMVQMRLLRLLAMATYGLWHCSSINGQSVSDHLKHSCQPIRLYHPF